MLTRPSKEEYAAHFGHYVDEVPEADIREALAQSLRTTTELYATFSEDRANYRYAPGKWSLKQVLGHVADNERIMAYRALRIARGDRTPLAGYDENVLVNNASFDEMPLTAIVDDYVAVRGATFTLLNGVADEAWTRTGTVSGNESSARAWIYILAGHELHHLNVIRDRYLK